MLTYRELMVSMLRIVANWTGFSGAPGYTNLFFRNILPNGAPGNLDELASAALAQERTQDFFEAVTPYFPDDVKIQLDGTVDVLESTTGELTGSLTGNLLPLITGTSDTGYSAASGGVVGWVTSDIRNGRRIRGRTFLVPIRNESYTSSGRLGPNAVQAIQTAANQLVNPAGLNTFGIWARPSSSGAADGVWAPARAARVTDLPAILRSRRD